MSTTLIVNLYAGPGTGKSTTAAQVFALLKQMQVNTELCHEFAKDLTWEQRNKALSFQPYVAGKQMYRIWRLFGEVDVVINDSPILLCGYIYGEEGVSKAFLDHILDIHNSWNTLDIFLDRNPYRKYNTKGRNQTEEEAITVDGKILQMLLTTNTPYEVVPVSGTDRHAHQIVQKIFERMPNLAEQRTNWTTI